MTQEVIEGYRLSPQQRHLWALQQAGGGPAYAAQCAVLLEGALRTEALEEAVGRLVERHEILRTRFEQPETRSVPVQVISKAGVTWGPGRSLGRLDDAAFAERLEELLLEEAARSGDGDGRGPNLRAALLTRSPESHLLLLTLPALCADAAGLRNLVRELALCYECVMEGRELEEAPVQYADLAEWLSSLQESEETEVGRQYWRERDVSALHALALPGERPDGGAGRGFDVRRESRNVDAALRARLEAVAARYDASLSELALACWQVLLWRLTGQTQVVVGVGCEGRSYEGLEEAVGLFAKHLPLHAELSDELPFGELLGRVRESLREVYEWEEYFSWELLDRHFGAGRSALFFPFSFDFEESAPEVSAAGLNVSLLSAHACTERFKVNLACAARGDELRVEFRYDSRLLSTAAVRRLAEQFVSLLRSVAEDPERAVGALDVLGEEERGLLLRGLNDTGASLAENPHVCRLFERWAARAPERAAVIGPGGQLSYAELNRRANKVARHLRALGASAGTLVAVCVERTTEMAVAVLGVLKTGAAYVPLDPAYPKDRVAYMLDDTRAPLLLTQSHLLGGLPAHAARAVCLDADWPLISEQPDDDPGPYPTQSLAYVIYTSGSTGEPRGAMITHDNLGHYAQAIGEALGLTPDDRYLHTASVGFSSSVRQLLVPLAHGAAVAVATSEEKIDPVALFELVKRERATIIDLVPSHWRACTHALRHLEAARRDDLLENDLRLVLSASEPLTPDVARAWREEFRHPARLVNMFGQTETTGIVTAYPVEAGLDSRAKGVPVGRPLARTRIYLLDKRLRPAPFGAEGEMYIGGDGLGLGYLNRPGLTAERFVPDPFSTQPGRRLYRTGDAARYLPGGEIEFRNRIDYQVKVRGFRVELGEVEAALASHVNISEAVVVAHEEPGGETRLVAYVVPEQLPAPSADGLHSFLMEKLPGYMIPSAFVALEQLPLTPNGKIDRAALPAAGQASAACKADFVAPRTPVEQTLAEIWAEVLGLERVGVNDHFFRLGGHSLLATVLVSRVRDAFKIDLPVVSLFKAPTVSGLAGVIEQSLIGQADEELLAGFLQEMAELSDEEIRARLADGA